MALLQPRQSFGKSFWLPYSQYLIKCLPAGRQKVKELWLEQRDIYFKNDLHEGEALMYLFILCLTLDIKTTQYWLKGPKY